MAFLTFTYSELLWEGNTSSCCLNETTAIIPTQIGYSPLAKAEMLAADILTVPINMNASWCFYGHQCFFSFTLTGNEVELRATHATNGM